MTICRDASGNGKHGTYVAPPARVGGLVVGDGATDFSVLVSAMRNTATIPDGLIDWTGSFTIEAWCLGIVGPGDVVLVAEQSPSTNNVSLAGASGGFGFEINIQSLFDIYSFSPSSADFANRHHMVVTITNTTAPLANSAMYWDGVLVESVTGGARRAIDPPTEVIIGLTGNVLDEVAVYDYPLSSGQVAAHYAQRDDFAAYTLAVLADAPAGYYHLNDGDTAWILDAVGMGG